MIKDSLRIVNIAITLPKCSILSSYLSSPVSSFSSSSNTFLLVPITFFSFSSTTSSYIERY